MPSGTHETVDDRERAASLLQRWQLDDDRDALDELLQLEVGALRTRIAYRGRNMLSGSASASDVAQEAVTRMLRLSRRPSFDDPRALRAYLWRAAWRLLLNRAARPRRAVLRIDAERTHTVTTALAVSGGQSRVEDREQQVALLVAMNVLSEPDRQILDLVYLQGRDLGAAAEQFGISRDTATKRLSRARLALAKKLGGWSRVLAG